MESSTTRAPAEGGGVMSEMETSLKQTGQAITQSAKNYSFMEHDESSIKLGILVVEDDWKSFFFACISEFVGTMFFLLFVQGAVTTNYLLGDLAGAANRLIISFEAGMAIFVLVYIFAGSSGGHLNPAVTWGMMLGKRISVPRAFAYWISQLAGALVGAALARTISNVNFSENPFPTVVRSTDFGKGDAFGALLLADFILILTYFAASSGTLRKRGHHVGAHAPYAIGMAYFVGYVFLMPITAGAMNPARSFAAAAAAHIWNDQWIFWLGTFAGATLAPIYFELFMKPAWLEPGTAAGVKPVEERGAVTA